MVYKPQRNIATLYKTQMNFATVNKTQKNIKMVYKMQTNIATVYKTQMNFAAVYETKRNSATVYETQRNHTVAVIVHLDLLDYQNIKKSVRFLNLHILYIIRLHYILQTMEDYQGKQILRLSCHKIEQNIRDQ